MQDGGIIKGKNETLVDDEYLHYFDCGDYFIIVYIMSKLKLYTLNVFNLLYCNYTSVKLPIKHTDREI